MGDLIAGYIARRIAIALMVVGAIGVVIGWLLS